MPRRHCDNKTRFILNNALPGTYQVVTHAGCLCNELRALCNRHLIDRSTIPFEKQYYHKLANKIFREFDIQPVDKVGYWTIINGYVGSKRLAYMRAYDQLKLQGFQKKFAYVKMFVKPDKFPSAKARVKPPRAIQYRGPEFNLEVARYLKPIEEAFYNLKSPSGFRFVAKGLNNVERALLLRDISLTYNNPAYVLLDHSHFDSTINVEHLRTCHRLYKRFNPSGHLQKLLQFQINNRGFTKNGIHYKVKGTRMSGDYDTALGNCIVNYIALRGWLKQCHVRGDIILDGDDSILIVERASLPYLDYSHFGKCGFETKHEVVYDLASVEFCQSKYMDCNPPRFSRNPIRALSRLNISVRDYYGSGWNRYQAGIGLGEMATNQGVPILYAVGRKLALLSNKPIFDTESYYKTVVNLDPPVIDAEVREQFYRAWGITPHDQELIESTYTPRLRSSASELIQCYYSLPEDAEETLPHTR